MEVNAVEEVMKKILENIKKRDQPQMIPPLVAARTSSRIPSAGMTMLKLAEQRVVKKNLEVSGISSKNIFSILQDIESDKLVSIAENWSSSRV